MGNDSDAQNHLVSVKPSDSNFAISLHPLVLLTVSDHVTRHRVRNQGGPVVGALLGQQRGRAITVEHAFECKTIINCTPGCSLDLAWFEERLQQCRFSSISRNRQGSYA